MISALAFAGWTVAALAITAAVIGELQRARRLEQVARAAHELRGPITAARLGVGLGVRMGALSEGRLHAVELELERAALALADFAGTAAGAHAPPGPREVRLPALLAACAEAWSPAAAAREGEIRVVWPLGEVVIHGERLRIAQAVDNLIANAIEHGGGTVEVRGRLDAGSVRIEVTDCGAGLPAPVAELSRRARRGRGSRGRGLAIASAIAREHGGRLAAAPSDRGARLLLELPLPDLPGSGQPEPASRPGS
ncbi:MAG: HAMP domain-containing histidine kinase [Solirubrobacterales bacterium]|nr:HAMP domain-containing histidine kinase [Solirubrobacterales bacterium]